MADVIVQYPLDYTGQALTNYITGEQQILTAVNHRNYHFIVPKFAPFFVNNFRIFLNNNGQMRALEEGKDYLFSLPFIGASRGCATPVYGAISFNNLQLAGVIVLSYQTLGGDWVLDTEAALEVAANAVYNPRVTSWEVITNAPTTFPPVPHAWDLIDMVGEKELVDQLQKIEQAILSTATQAYSLHLNRLDNPHKVTKEHVGLGNVPNYLPATMVEMDAGKVSNRFVTPAGLGALKNNINQHKNDSANPHKVTKEHVGLGYVQNWPLATPTETIQGTATDRYVGLHGLQAKFNDFLANVSNYVPSIALQLLQQQMTSVLSRLTIEEDSTSSIVTTLQGITRTLSDANQQIGNSVKIDSTNLGAVVANTIAKPTLVGLSERVNGYMGLLRKLSYYQGLNIPVDTVLYPGVNTEDYSFFKLTSKGNTGAADWLAVGQSNLYMYIGAVNNANTGITWTRLSTAAEQTQAVARITNLEELTRLTQTDINTLNTSAGSKLVSFNNLLYYTNKYTQSNYTKVIDLTGLSTDYFFPVWWMDQSYLDKTGNRIYVSITRQESDDYLLNAFGETYADGTPTKQVGAVGFTFETNGNIFSRPSSAMMKVVTHGQTYRDLVRLPRYAMKCYFMYSNKAGQNYPRDANQQDYQVTSFKGGSGVYLRGGLTYMLSTNHTELLQSVRYSRLRTEVELGYYIISALNTQLPGETYPANNREMGFYTRGFHKNDPFLEGAMPITNPNDLPLSSQADDILYSNARTLHYYTKDTLNPTAPVLLVNPDPNGVPTNTNPF